MPQPTTIKDCMRRKPLTINLDANLIEELLINLVKNALEAAEFGGRIELTAESTLSNSVAICVGDNGPGIDESVRDSLFLPFVTTKSTGTGIGLALSKKIVEEHGGSIDIETSDLGGARFRIVLPVAPN